MSRLPTLTSAAFLILLLSHLIPSAAAAVSDCGFDHTQCCQYRRLNYQPAIGKRGVNDIGNASARPARWANNNSVPSSPNRRTVVTYSIVTGASENHANKTLEPVATKDFIDADTIAAIREGVESWNDTCGILLTYVSSGGQLRVGTVALSGSAIGLGGFTAKSWDGVDWVIDEGFIQLDKSHSGWTRALLRSVAAHEAGHAIGLKHTNVSALMYPSINGVIGPIGDDRWYAQFLYGASVPRLKASSDGKSVTLSINKSSPIQTGTHSDDTFQGSAARPKGPGTGTGTLTQNSVLRYVVERRGPGQGSYSFLASAVASSGSQHADATLPGTQNAFTFRDATFPQTGTYTYRVKAVHEGSGEDALFSEERQAIVTSLADDEEEDGGGGSRAPTITSELSATAYVGASFSYNITATGANPITFSSSVLPPGLVLSGDTILGTPSTAGIYSVDLSASNSFGSDSKTVVLTVVNSASGTISVSKLLVKLNFKKANRDLYMVKSQVELPKDFDVPSTILRIGLGGLLTESQFDGKGRVKVGNFLARLKVKNGTGLLIVKSKNTDLAGELADEGLTNEDASGRSVKITVTVTIGEHDFVHDASLMYRAKAGKKGIAR